MKASDPDSDTIVYGIDWDTNGVVDQWLPVSGSVASNTLLNATKSWSTTGIKTFQALTKDSKGALSTWAIHTLTLSNPPMNGIC